MTSINFFSDPNLKQRKFESYTNWLTELNGLFNVTKLKIITPNDLKFFQIKLLIL